MARKKTQFMWKNVKNFQNHVVGRAFSNRNKTLQNIPLCKKKLLLGQTSWNSIDLVHKVEKSNNSCCDFSSSFLMMNTLLSQLEEKTKKIFLATKHSEFLQSFHFCLALNRTGCSKKVCLNFTENLKLIWPWIWIHNFSY